MRRRGGGLRSIRRAMRHATRDAPTAAAPATWQEEEAAIDKEFLAAGFTRGAFSQRRASHQTAGIPDRIYLHPVLRVAVWWEAKHGQGKLTPEQAEFHALLRRCGMRVEVGGVAEARRWLAALMATGVPPDSSELPELPDAAARAAAALGAGRNLAAEPPGAVVAGPNGGLLRKGADGIWRQVRHQGPA